MYVKSVGPSGWSLTVWQLYSLQNLSYKDAFVYYLPWEPAHLYVGPWDFDLIYHPILPVYVYTEKC